MDIFYHEDDQYESLRLMKEAIQALWRREPIHTAS